MKDVRSRGEFVQCRQGGGSFQMRTSAFIGAKTRIFESLWSVRTDKGVEPGRTREGRSIFSDFVRTPFIVTLEEIQRVSNKSTQNGTVRPIELQSYGRSLQVFDITQNFQFIHSVLKSNHIKF